MQTDQIKPWTIKAIAVEARDLAITAARLEGVSVGIWLERQIRAAAAGKPVANLSAPRGAPLGELLAVADCAGLTQWIRRGAGRQIAARLGIAPPPSRRHSPNRERIGGDSDAGASRQGGGQDQSARGENLIGVADRGGELATGGRPQERLGHADQERGGAQSDDAGAADEKSAVAA